MAVNQTTQQVIMNRTGAGLVSNSFACSAPRVRGVHTIMNDLSKRMVKGTAQILSKPQPRTNLHTGPSQMGQTFHLGDSLQPRMQQLRRSLHTTSKQEASSLTAGSLQSRPVQDSLQARRVFASTVTRTKLAPGVVRSQGTKRTFATETGHSSNAASSQNAMVKYTPPIGPLDRVGRAKLLSAAPNFMARLRIRLKLLLMRQIRPWRVDDFIAMFSWAFIANVAFVLLGTTTFFSLVLATANSLQFQGKPNKPKHDKNTN